MLVIKVFRIYFCYWQFFFLFGRRWLNRRRPSFTATSVVGIVSKLIIIEALLFLFVVGV